MASPRDATVAPTDAATAALSDTPIDRPEAGSPGCTAPLGPYAPLSTRCGHFVDTEGRVVILHGINARVDGVFDVSLDMGRAVLETIPAFAMSDAVRMRALGFNLLRLPIQWSGVEPTATGGFDEHYLDRVAAAVGLANATGILVLLDFHQDAYSKEIGEDGAPLWAIAPPPTMLLQGPLTDLGVRRASTQVLEAFQSFFGDGTVGDTLRARFAAMAGHVAGRFAGVPGVVGYEFYNEPQGTTEELLRVYQLTADAIRARDPGRLLMFEPDVVYRDVFNRSETPSGVAPWGGGVYAPHTYPLAFGGTPAQLSSFTTATLAPATVSARAEATAWGTPLLITEWGYGPSGVRATDYLQAMAANQESVMASEAFWLWKEESQGSWGFYDHDSTTGTWTERASVRSALARVRPQAIAGWPESWSYDPATQVFVLSYVGDGAVTAPTEVYIPESTDYPMNFRVLCDGSMVAVTRDPATGVVSVPCSGPGRHTVVVRPS